MKNCTFFKHWNGLGMHKNYFKQEWVLFRSTLPQISFDWSSTLSRTSKSSFLLWYLPLIPSHHTQRLSTPRCFPYKATDSSSPVSATDDYEREGSRSLESWLTMKNEIKVSNDHLPGQIIHSWKMKRINKPKH